MDKVKMDRISELSRKERSVGLSPEEKKEQTALRTEYIEEFRGNMKNILDNTYIQRPDGSKEKLQQKKTVKH